MHTDFQVPMISKSLQNTYAININSILRVIKRKCVESIVSEMLGSEALRVFKMLQQFKYMEEDQVGQNFTFVFIKIFINNTI